MWHDLVIVMIELVMCTLHWIYQIPLLRLTFIDFVAQKKASFKPTTFSIGPFPVQSVMKYNVFIVIDSDFSSTVIHLLGEFLLRKLN